MNSSRTSVGSVSEADLRKLVLAKSLFLHGRNHAGATDEISRMLAIHHFDNAAEMVLKCVASKLELGPKKRFFYFEDLLRNIPDLPLRAQISDLHNLRNVIQHQGDIPDSETVVKYEGYTEDFLREIIRNKFRISFDELGLASLIENAKLRKMIQQAENSFRSGNTDGLRKSIEFCDKALNEATFRVADIFGKAGMLTGYFGAGDELKAVIDQNYAEKYKGTRLYDLANDVSKAALQLAQASTSMQFLGKYSAKFLKFRDILRNIDKIPPDELKEKAEFSLNFVTELILKWQEEIA